MRWWTLIALSIVTAPALGAACGDGMPMRARSSDGTAPVVAFRSDPAPIVVGRHFALDVQLCPTGSMSLPTALRVDAEMPAHRHGMNYSATVKALPGLDRWRAEGLMFHMPGRWRFIFDLKTVDGPVRVTHEVDVP